MSVSAFSHVGRYHTDAQIGNQDAVRHAANDRFIVISLADGVSSCKEAKAGAEIACDAITNLLLKKGDYFLEFDPKKSAHALLTHVLFELKCKADEESKDLNEYSSTLASVLIDYRNKKVFCFSLGDSIILAVEEGKCKILATPSDSSSGCIVTTTEKAEGAALVKKVAVGSNTTIAICSDGAWEQMYEKGKLKSDVAEILSDNDFTGLEEYLIKQKSFDDYSVISTDIPRGRSKSA